MASASGTNRPGRPAHPWRDLLDSLQEGLSPPGQPNTDPAVTVASTKSLIEEYIVTGLNEPFEPGPPGAFLHDDDQFYQHERLFRAAELFDRLLFKGALTRRGYCDGQGNLQGTMLAGCDCRYAPSDGTCYYSNDNLGWRHLSITLRTDQEFLFQTRYAMDTGTVMAIHEVGGDRILNAHIQISTHEVVVLGPTAAVPATFGKVLERLLYDMSRAYLVIFASDVGPMWGMGYAGFNEDGYIAERRLQRQILGRVWLWNPGLMQFGSWMLRIRGGANIYINFNGQV